jgi:catechol 2,3-dioxygenase-like lactoylglutathione lyase family enzyme
MLSIPSRRRLDHLVLPARDLEASGEFYRRLGFQVGARNRHPWGTENRLVQFGGTFLELITLREGAEPPPHGTHQFSFGRHVADWLNVRGDGFSMAVLSSPDAASDAAWFRQAGIGDTAQFHFARTGKRPDGSAVEVAFTLAFATPAAAPHLSFFVCQQHFPENFWNAAFQSHENTVTGVARVVMTHPKPLEMSGFLKAFGGGAPAADGADGLTLGLQESALSSGRRMQRANASPMILRCSTGVRGNCLPSCSKWLIWRARNSHCSQTTCRTAWRGQSLLCLRAQLSAHC